MIHDTLPEQRNDGESYSEDVFSLPTSERVIRHYSFINPAVDDAYVYEKTPFTNR